MTPDERSILQQFLYDLGQTRGVSKDPEADAMISQVARASPDAMYLLVQHAIIADQALHAAQAQIEQMEQQVAVQPGQTSFLGGGQPAPQAGWSQGQVQGGGWNGSEPPTASQQQGPLSANSGLGSFMRTAGTMAAGVAGGEFLANGLSNLFGGRRDW